MISKYIMVAGVSASLFTGCRKDFAEVNTNPTIVTTPDIKYLFTYSQQRVMTYDGGEWIWEGMEQLMRFTQHITSSPYEVTGNVNGRYGVFYTGILPNLFEVRRQIAALPDKERYRQMEAMTYVIQVLHGIKVTDMNGSIPYTEVMQGRYEGNYSPKYDSQETLFNTWLSELDNAIAALSDGSGDQATYGTSDIFYLGDTQKWIQLANTLKLRIAARLENQNAAKTAEIFKQVMQQADGPIASDAAQLSFSSPDHSIFGNDINYRSVRYASTSILNFMKAADDPRIPIYFESNDLEGSYLDTLAKYGATLPAFINPADPWINYQGGPADWNVEPTVAAYISTAFAVGNTDAPGNTVTRYFLISPINRNFFSPRYNGGTGNYTNALVTNAESCLLVAEFIEKGYGAGIDTKGSAEDWYKKGVASSLRTMNAIAVTAQSGAGLSSDATTAEAEIEAYLNGPEVAFNGSNDLERIYIQQYLNLYRNANEAYVFVRRTGYPKNNSTYYPREEFNEQIPRRWWLMDPGEVNRDNWAAAMSEQGFTQNAQDLPTLSSQRVWYDKPAPEFGEGE